jgi:hypothetical protein
MWRLATSWTVRCSNTGGGKRFAALYTLPNQFWGPPSFLFNGYQGCASRVKRPGRGFDTLLHLAPRLRMGGAILLLPFCVFMGSCGVTFNLTNRIGRIFSLLTTLYRTGVPKTETLTAPCQKLTLLIWETIRIYWIVRHAA